MTFKEAVRHGLQRLTDFNGRATRSEFWWFYLFVQLVSQGVVLVLTFVYMIVVFASTASAASGDGNGAAIGTLVGGSIAWYLLIFLVAIASTLLLAAATVRRLHDTGHSWQWYLLSFAGAGIVVTVLCIMESQPHANAYGPDPLAGQRRPQPIQWGYPPRVYQPPGYPPPGYGHPPYPPQAYRPPGYGHPPYPPQAYPPPGYGHPPYPPQAYPPPGYQSPSTPQPATQQ